MKITNLKFWSNDPHQNIGKKRYLFEVIFEIGENSEEKITKVRNKFGNNYVKKNFRESADLSAELTIVDTYLEHGL